MNNFIRFIINVGKLIIVAIQLVYVWLGFSINLNKIKEEPPKEKAKSKTYVSDRNKYGFPIL